MNQIFTLYRNAFGGLSKPAWALALVMLINRSGSMVVPFMSVYLTEALGFSLKRAGIILSLFGLGSMVGSYLGGWLTDRIGHFRVQFFSLVLGGIMFFVLMQLKQFEYLAAGIFILSILTESLRPANASSITHYANPENLTRAFSLNRMAINLGFSIGPVLAGLLATISYQLLFMADGVTCLLAGLFFYLYFRHRKGDNFRKLNKPETTIASVSPYQDFYFILFVVFTICFATVFFQFFSTLPLYYRQVYKLSEAQIGLLLGLNGFVVFSLEMIVEYVASTRFRFQILIISGVLLTGISLMLLNIFTGSWILIPSMVLLSVSEILVMPFLSTITVHRSDLQNRGAYMGFYSLAYSTAFILGPFLGTSIIAAYSFTTLWWLSGILSVFTGLGFYWVLQGMKVDEKIKNN